MKFEYFSGIVVLLIFCFWLGVCRIHWQQDDRRCMESVWESVWSGAKQNPKTVATTQGFHMFSRRTEPGLARPESTALTSDLVVPLWSTVTRFRPIPGHNEWVAGHVTQIARRIGRFYENCSGFRFAETGWSKQARCSNNFQNRLLHAMLGRFWKKSVECVKGHGHVVFQRIEVSLQVNWHFSWEDTWGY